MINRGEKLDWRQQFQTYGQQQFQNQWLLQGRFNNFTLHVNTCTDMYITCPYLCIK